MTLAHSLFSDRLLSFKVLVIYLNFLNVIIMNKIFLILVFTMLSIAAISSVVCAGKTYNDLWD